MAFSYIRSTYEEAGISTVRTPPRPKMGGLPEENVECAVLSVAILRDAIKDGSHSGGG